MPWLALGIKSEEGREKDITFNRSAQNPGIYEVRNRMREKIGHDPSWDEITDYCQKHNIPMMSGTSIFDPVLCELVYRWFNLPEGKILDPFAGGSVRGIVAAKLGMSYRGVDLRPEQVKANYENAAEIQPPLTANECPIWKCGDSCDIDQHFTDLKADLLFSCPPYADLEVYSDNPRDLSNMDIIRIGYSSKGMRAGRFRMMESSSETICRIIIIRMVTTAVREESNGKQRITLFPFALH